MAELDFSNAPTVQGIGHRFIIPVPNLGDENKTLTVKNWKGEAQTIVGYGFSNETDRAPQAVVGDGTGVIIVALNPEAVDLCGAAKAIHTCIEDLGGAGGLTVAKLDKLMDFIHNTLVLPDTYNSNDSIASTMKPQEGLVPPGERPCGLFKKVEKPGPRAVYVKGKCSVLDGPHAGAATYPGGFLAVQIPPKKEGQEPTYRSIAPGAIGYCYQFEDGKAIAQNLDALPVINVK